MILWLSMPVLVSSCINLKFKNSLLMGSLHIVKIYDELNQRKIHPPPPKIILFFGGPNCTTIITLKVTACSMYVYVPISFCGELCTF